MGAAALFLAPEGALGLAVGLALGAEGNLLGATVTASINDFLLVAPSGSVGQYFDNLLGPIGELREALLKGETFAQNSLYAIANAPTPNSLFSELQSVNSDNQQLLSAYRLQTFNEFNSLQYTDNILTQIANAYAVINPGLAVQVELTAALVAKYAVSLVNTYVTNSKILSGLIAAEQSTQTTVLAAVNLLEKDPNNQGALNTGYGALDSLTGTISTVVQELQELDKSSSSNDLTASNYGQLIANTSVNGTIQGATTSADLLIGTTAAEIFDGLGSNGGTTTGTDVVIGGGGADTFIFNVGYGSLEINEDDPSGASSAVLKLGAGITASMIKVTGAGNGSVLLTIGTNGDNILIDGELAGPEYGVTEIEFSNNTFLTRAQLTQMATVATTGADTLYGSSNGETFNGLGGGDKIISTGDSDTYIFDRGYGTLEINATDTAATPKSQLLLGTGILPTDVLVTADQSGDLVLTVESNGAADGDVITLDFELAGSKYGVQSVVFSNGTTWTHQQLLQFAAAPTTGADDLYLSTAGTIDGLGGGDIIHGSGGADTFIYKSGYGSLEISEAATTGASTATLMLENGLQLGTATVTGDSSGDILLHFSPTDVVTIDQALSGASYGVAKVIDSTGATLTAAQLVTDELNGAAGSLTVYGTSGGDTFTNLGKGDVAVGNGGGDTFNYASGAGALDIQEFDTNAADKNVLVLSGISSTQATFTLVKQTFGTGIVLTDGVTGDKITIDSMDSDSAQGVSALEFLGNKVTLTRAQVLGLAVGTMTITGIGTQSAPLTGGAGSNIITATASHAYITSPGLYDQITDLYGSGSITLTTPANGGNHDATIAFGGGGNTVTAVDGNVTVTGVSGLDRITLGNGNGVVKGGGNSNTISVLTGNTSISLGSATAASSSNTISLESGGTITLYGKTNLVTLGNATVTDPTQYGSSKVIVSGSSNNINVLATNNETVGDGAGSSGNMFSLTSPLANTVNVLGSSDMVFVAGGQATISDGGSGTDIYVSNDANLIVSNFTTDAKSLMTLMPSEGYSSLSSLLAALTSDGNGGSFLALGGSTGTGTGIDFAGVSVAALTSFANSGTHFAFATTFPSH